MSEGPFYWSLKHSRVEGPEGEPHDRRLGPFDTREQAAAALQTAKERTEKWDAEDREWDRDS